MQSTEVCGTLIISHYDAHQQMIERCTSSPFIRKCLEGVLIIGQKKIIGSVLINAAI